MVMTPVAAQLRAKEYPLVVQDRPVAAASEDAQGAYSWARRSPHSQRARAYAAELVLLHRLRACQGGAAGVPEQAARVIELTAQIWL